MVPVRLSIMVLMICLVAGAGSSYCATTTKASPSPSSRRIARQTWRRRFRNPRQAVRRRNRLSCHSDKKQKGGFSLEKYQTHQSMLEDPAQWETVVRKLQAGEMPPEDEPQPDKAQVKTITQWVGREITRAETAAAVDPGRVTTRRLNRTEYNNSIRDLLAVDIRPADEFPQDDSGYGFDNIGDVLSLPPVLMERYLAAADKVVRAAIYGAEVMKPTLTRVTRGSGRSRSARNRCSTTTRRASTPPNALHATHLFPVDGDYTFKVSLGGLRPAGPTRWRSSCGSTAWSCVTTRRPGWRRVVLHRPPGFLRQNARFQSHMTAGSHWIAGTVPRMAEGLPAKYNGPNPTKRPPPPPEVFAAAERDAGTDRASAEVLRGAPEGNRAGRRAARQLHRDRRAIRSEEWRVRRRAARACSPAVTSRPTAKAHGGDVSHEDRDVVRAPRVPPPGDGRGNEAVRLTCSTWRARTARRSTKASASRCRGSWCRPISCSASNAIVPSRPSPRRLRAKRWGI